jgi:hypothetical protein
MKRLTKEREQELIMSVPKGAALLGYPVKDIDILHEYGMRGDFAMETQDFESVNWATCDYLPSPGELWICRQEDYNTLEKHFVRPWENKAQTPETTCCLKDELASLKAAYEATRQDLWAAQNKLKQAEAELNKFKPVEPAVGQIWLGTRSNTEYRLISFETPEGKTMYGAVGNRGIFYGSIAWSDLQEVTQKHLEYLRES